MKKFLAFIPLFALCGFMYWMHQNYYGIATISFGEGEAMLSIENAPSLVIEDGVPFSLWAGSHSYTLERAGFDPVSGTLHVGYNEDVFISHELDLSPGFSAIDTSLFESVDLAYRSSVYSDNLFALQLTGVDVDISSYAFTGSYLSLSFSNDGSRALGFAGDVINRTSALYTSSGDVYSLPYSVISYDWFDSGELLALVSRSDQVELGRILHDGTFVLIREISDLGSLSLSLSPLEDRAILFAKGSLSDRALYVIDLVTGEARRISQNGYISDYVWFDDGNTLLIERAAQGSALPYLYVKNLLSGEEKTVLYDVSISEVAALSDGNLIIALDRTLDVDIDGEYRFADVLERIQDRIGSDSGNSLGFYYLSFADGAYSPIYSHAEKDFEIESMEYVGGYVIVLSNKGIYRLIFEQ